MASQSAASFGSAASPRPQPWLGPDGGGHEPNNPPSRIAAADDGVRDKSWKCPGRVEHGPGTLPRWTATKVLAQPSTMESDWKWRFCGSHCAVALSAPHTEGVEFESAGRRSCRRGLYSPGTRPRLLCCFKTTSSRQSAGSIPRLAGSPNFERHVHDMGLLAWTTQRVHRTNNRSVTVHHSAAGRNGSDTFWTFPGRVEHGSSRATRSARATPVP